MREGAWQAISCAAAVVVAAIAIAGCGGSTPTSAAAPTAVLLEHLPPGTSFVREANLVTARARLGLPVDARFASGLSSMKGPQALFSEVAAGAFPDLARPVNPIMRVLDPGKVTVLVWAVPTFSATTPFFSAVLIATSQSQSSLRARFASAGYVRHGQQWSTHLPAPRPGMQYAALFPGGIALTGDSATASRVAVPRTAGASNAAVVALLKRAGAAPIIAGEALPSGCVKSITITDWLSPHTGGLEIATRTAPDVARLRTGPLEPDRGSPVASKPTVDHGLLHATLSQPGSGTPRVPFTFATTDTFSAHDFYPC